MEIPAFPALIRADNLLGVLVMVRALTIAAIISLVTAMSGNFAHSASCPDGPQMQQFRAQRNALAREASIYRGAGLGLKYQEALTKLELFDVDYPYIFLDQEIRNFPLFGNVACLITAMRTASGQDLKYQPYTDGKFDLLMNGQKIRDRISAAELLSIAKSMR